MVGTWFQAEKGMHYLPLGHLLTGPYIILYVYMYTYIKNIDRFEIGLHKFVNKFIRYQIIICNLLII